MIKLTYGEIEFNVCLILNVQLNNQDAITQSDEFYIRVTNFT